MDLSSLPGQFSDWATGVWRQFEALLQDSPILAAAGIALALGVGLGLAALILASFVRLFVIARRSGLAAKVKRDTEVGARILIVKGDGGRRRAIADYLGIAIDKHL